MSFDTVKGFKNASFLTIGNIITQIISFFAVIYIARELGVSNYGIYITVGTFVSLFHVFLILGINKVIVREGSKNFEKLSSLLNSTFGLRSISIIIAIIICIISSFISSYDTLTKLLIIIHSHELAYFGFRGIFYTIYQINEEMHYISILKILNKLIFVFFSILFLYLGYGVISLFIITLFANLFTLILNYKLSSKFSNFEPNLKINVDPKIIKSSIIFSLMIFVGFLTTKIDLLMISFLGGVSAVGQYAVSYKLIRQMMVLRNMTSMAFFPMVVKYLKVKKISQSKIVYTALSLFIFFSIISIIISFFSESIISLLFGPSYIESGKILKYLGFFLPIWWAALPYTTIAQAIHEEKIILYSKSFMAVLNIVFNYMLYIQYGLIGIVYSTLIVYYAGSITIIIWVHRIMRKKGVFELVK